MRLGRVLLVGAALLGRSAGGWADAIPPLPDPRDPNAAQYTHRILAGTFGSGLLQADVDRPSGVLGSVGGAAGGRGTSGSGPVRAVEWGLLPTFDVTPPVSAIVEPGQCLNPATAADIHFRVTASDRRQAAPENGRGVDRVEMGLQDLESGLWWNGAQWSGTETWIALGPNAARTEWTLADATIQSWGAAWVAGKAYLVRSRAIDVGGNVESQPSASAVAFSFARTTPFVTIDFPENGRLYSDDAGQPVGRIEGRSCNPGTGTAVDAVLVRLQVTTTTNPADPALGHYWTGNAWTPTPVWLTSAAVAGPAWRMDRPAFSHPDGRSAFACRTAAGQDIPECGRGIRVAALARAGVAPPEDQASTLTFYFDEIRPVGEQLLPLEGSKLNTVPELSGVAKDCGNATVGNPLVEVSLVRMRWAPASGGFADTDVTWSGTTRSWTAGPQNWLGGVLVTPRPNVDRCPADGGWSYDWRFDSRLVEWENGYRYHIHLRTSDTATNSSQTLGNTLHFDNVAPAGPAPTAVDPATNQPIPSACSPHTSPCGVWQNITASPLFTWPEPFDDCGASPCPDPDRQSSGIKEYDTSFGVDPAGGRTGTQPASDLDYQAVAPALEGTFYFRVWARDAAQNLSTPSTFEVKYEHTPPVVGITSPADQGVFYSVSRIEGTVADPGLVASGIESGGVRVSLSEGSTVLLDAPAVLSGGGDTWSLEIPDGTLRFGGQYTVLARAVDRAGNEATATSTFGVSRPFANPPFGTDQGRKVADFFEPYNITFHVTNPLTVPVTIAIRFKEQLDAASGFFTQSPVWEEYPGLSAGPDETSVYLLEPGETQAVSITRQHEWRWFGPAEPDDLAVCLAMGLGGVALDAGPGPLGESKKLKKIGAKITELLGEKGAKYAGKALRHSIETAFTVDEIKDVSAMLGASVSDADFTYRVETVSAGPGLAPVDVQDIDNLLGRAHVNVPDAKVNEIIVAISLSVAAEITSIAADFFGPFGKAIGLAAEAGMVVAQCALNQSAADPDPVFDVLPTPQYHTVEEVTSDPDVLGDPAARRFLQTYLDLLSNQKALLASRNKLWGALSARSDEWTMRQSAAMRQYSALASEGYRDVAGQLDLFLANARARGITLSDAEIADSMRTFRENGLPPLEKDILRFHGYTDAAMDEIARQVGTPHPDAAEQRAINDLSREEFAALPEAFRDVAGTFVWPNRLFTDTFDDGVLDGWLLRSGSWGLAPAASAGSYVLEGGASSEASTIVTTETFTGGRAIEVTVNHSGQPVSVLWNVRDDLNYYELLVAPGSEATLEAFVVEAGVRRSIAGPVIQPLPVQDGHVVRVETVGGHHSFYLDFVLQSDDPALVGVPWLWAEADDATFTGGSLGLRVERLGDHPTLFDNVTVTTNSDGVLGSLPGLSVTPSPDAPTDQEPVRFDVEAPADSVDVRLYVDGREAAKWDQGGSQSWTSDPFTRTCRVDYSATARLADGRLVVPPASQNLALSVADTTPPTLTTQAPRIVVEAQQCEGGTGWVDYVPWNNVQIYDACETNFGLTPAAGVAQRYTLGTTTTVDLTALDSAGRPGLASFEVEVVNTAPTIGGSAPAAAVEGSPVTLFATASDLRSRSLTFRWNWGDGSPDAVTPYLGLTSPATASASATHVYGDNGSYVVTITVEDDCLAIAATTTTVTVANAAPTIQAPDRFVLTEDYATALAVTAADAGSDDLTFKWTWSVPSLPEQTGIHYNNGTSPDPSPSGPGVAPFSATDRQAVSYGTAGELTLTIVVTDDDGGSATAAIPVKVTRLFSNATLGSGIDLPGAGGGAIWCDLNQDGLLDVLINAEPSPGSASTRLLFGNGDGTFTDVTATHAAGLAQRGVHRAVVCGDVNGDGYVDVARLSLEKGQIFFNQGPLGAPPFSFGDAQGEPNLESAEEFVDLGFEGLGILDFDNDGVLDGVVGSNKGLVLGQVDAQGVGHVVPGRHGLPSHRDGDFLTVGDYNLDGRVDVLSRQSRDFNLSTNIGSGQFSPNRSFTERGASETNKGGVALCDLDADGDFDIVWTDAGITQIWRNNGGTFVPTGEPALSSGIDLSGAVLDGVVCGDVDNDGDQDVFLSATSGPSYLFLNETGPGSASPLVFTRKNSGIEVGANAPSIAFGDYDRDGDLDLLVSVDGGVNQLWRNQRNDSRRNDYLAVRALRCTGDAFRDDIGATIRLFEADGVTPVGGVREVNGGSGHGSQSPAVVHFGLPEGPHRAYVVEVRFLGLGADAGPVIRQTVVPAELGTFQLLEVKACPVRPN